MPDGPYAVDRYCGGVSEAHLLVLWLHGLGLFVSLLQNHDVKPTETGRAGPVQR